MLYITVGNSLIAYLKVNTFADLPGAVECAGEIYIVLTATGIWGINRKRAGLYYSDGATWAKLGKMPPELVTGGETTLHSHPDGGNGSVVKTGTITTDGSGLGSVVFNTPFTDMNYAICLTCGNPQDTVIAMWGNRQAGGFDVKTEDDRGGAESNVIVDWIAIPHSNL